MGVFLPSFVYVLTRVSAHHCAGGPNHAGNPDSRHVDDHPGSHPAYRQPLVAKHSVAPRFATMGRRCALVARLIQAMLRQVHSNDVFRLPPEE